MTAPFRIVYCPGATPSTGRRINLRISAGDDFLADQMTLWRTIGEILAHWTDTVATGVIALASRFFSPRVVRLVEDTPDTFALEGTGKAGDAQRVTFANGRFGGADLADAVKGSRIELVLRPSRFL